MTYHEKQFSAVRDVLRILTENGLDGMAQAIGILMNEAMKAERTEFLGAEPDQRTAALQGYANGFKPKTVKSRIGSLELAIPQVRETQDPLYPRSLERGLRSERALKLAVAEMYEGGSTRKVAAVTEALCGFEVSSAQVSRAAQLLDDELEAWRNRELSEIPYLLLDARYEKVRYAGAVVDCALLIAVGITKEGNPQVLGASVSLSEAEVHWRDFLASLKARGMIGVRLIVSDDHAGLKAARKAGLPRVVTDESGAAVSFHNYYPFGQEMAGGGAMGRFKFTGHERDEETGLDYMKARFFNGPSFLSVDPLGASAVLSAPQTWNRYSYVSGDPIAKNDPMGLVEDPKTGRQVYDPSKSKFKSPDSHHGVMTDAPDESTPVIQLTPSLQTVDLKTPVGALTAALYLESTGSLATAATNPKSTALERNDALTALGQEMSLIGSTVLNRAAYADAQGAAGQSANGLGTPGGGVIGVLGAKGQYEGFSKDGSGGVALAPAQMGRLQAAMAAKEGLQQALQLGLAAATASFMVKTGSPFITTSFNGREINSTVMAQRTLGTGGPGFSAMSLKEAMLSLEPRVSSQDLATPSSFCSEVCMTRKVLSLLFGLTLFAQATVLPQVKPVPPPGWPKEAILWGLSDRIKEQLKVQVPHLIHWQYQWSRDSLGLRRDPVKAWEHYETFPKNKAICIEVVTDERELFAYSRDLGIGMSFTKFTHGLGKTAVWFMDPKNIPEDLETRYQRAVRSYRMREHVNQAHLPDAELQKLVQYTFWVPLGEFVDGRATMASNPVQNRILQMILDNQDIPLRADGYIEIVVPAFKEYDDAICVWAKYHGEGRPTKFVFTRNWDDDPDDLLLSNDLRGFHEEQVWPIVMK